MVLFGQIVVGPPGAGKTTFCDGIQQMCNALHRPCSIINLDPGNDELPYQCDIDVRDIIEVNVVIEKYKLGPNGALMFCMDFLLTNFEWLEEQIQIKCKEKYVVFDSPGQVELYTHHPAILNLIKKLIKRFDFRITSVHLIDSILCTEPSNFISALLVSLSGQLLLELPHVNVLTKLDLLKHHNKDLAFKIEYYAEVQDLNYLIDLIESSNLTPAHPFDIKFRKLNYEISELISDYNLVGFLPLDINDKESVLTVLKQIDTANGLTLSAYHEDPLGLFKIAVPNPVNLSDYTYGPLQERYLDDEGNEDFDV